SWDGARVTKGSETAIDAIAEGGSLAHGQALEFAIPAELLGEGANPVLESVERFTATLEDSVSDWTYEWVGNQLQVGLTLKAPLSEQPDDIELTEGYKLKVTVDSVTLVDGNSVATDIIDVSRPAEDIAGAELSFTIPGEDFSRTDPA